ncbi:MAG: class I SAM-dependent methyltransferase [Planctomyces sp.]
MIPQSVNLRTELIPRRPDQDPGVTAADGPFPLPGGWVRGTLDTAGQTWQLLLPADPNALLDEPSASTAATSDDRMPYWAFVWPAAIPMIAAVLQADWPAGTRVLELGCGTGIVGLAALRRGHLVTFTDYEHRAVALAARNAELNHCHNFTAQLLDWRRPENTTWPVIIGCDLLYQTSAFEPLLQLLDQMLAPGGVCWLGDGGRSAPRKFWCLARERGYDVQVLDTHGQPLSQPASDCQVFIIRKKAQP